MNRAVLSALAAAGLALAAACGGGGGAHAPSSVAPVPQQSGGTAAGSVTLRIPVATAASKARKAQFVSSGANSATVAVNGGAATVYDISSTSTFCSTSGGLRSCQIPITAMSGPLSVAVTLYASVTGSGAPLGSASGSTTVSAPSRFTVTIDIDPYVQSMSATATYTFANGLPTIGYGITESGTMNVGFIDPAGVTISANSLSTFQTPITFSSSDTHVTITSSATSAASPITIAYDGSLAVAPQITFTAKEGATTLGTYVMNTTGYYTELTIPTASSNPIGIAPGSDGGMWFTEFSASKIGHVVSPLSATSTLLDYPTPTSSEAPFRIAPAPAGVNYMFYTDPAFSNYGRVNTTASPAPQESSGPAFTGVTAVGASMFLSVPSPNPVFKINPSTQANQGTLGILSCSPAELAGGADGNLWVACNNTNLVEIVNPTTFASSIPITLPAGAIPAAIVAGPDNAMWVCDTGRSDIVRISLAAGNAITSYATTAGCYGITLGHDNEIWYTNFSPSVVGRVDVVTGQVVEFPVPGGGVRGISTGSDGWLWFTESTGNKIGRMQTSL